MRFTYYTLKNVKQCAQALNERIKQPDGGKARPAMAGSVDAKTGDFTLTLETKVAFGVDRQTQLRGSLTKDGNYTTIQGNVSEGVPPGKIRLVIGALVIVGFIIMAQGLVALGMAWGLSRHRGAGPEGVTGARAFVKRHGLPALENVAKLHFRTTQGL